MPAKTMKIETLDRIFSNCIRESYDYRCQYPDCPECGNHPMRSGGLDCSHYYGRRYRGGRWYPDNCIALCREIHGYVDTHNSVQVSLMLKHLGETRHDMLVERMHANFHIKPFQRWEMGQHYNAELRRIMDLRALGQQGYIELVAYD